MSARTDAPEAPAQGTAALAETLASHPSGEQPGRASLDTAATLERVARATIEPPRRSDIPSALDGTLAMLAQLGARPDAIERGATLGQGGMGVVHLGHHRALGRDVALKKVRRDARSPATTLKLLREAWVTGSLEHPNVVPIYDVRLDADGEPEIVLKKIEGAAWSELCADARAVRARFHEDDLEAWNLRVLMQVASAAHYAHSRGILHRDLKPENVMIGAFGEVYLVDWGLAVALDDDGTGRLPLARDAHDLAGTPCYMAPEMAGGREVRLSPRTDVYLLGAILFELATGAPPRDGPNLLAIVAQLTLPVEVPAHVPEELARILRRALDPDPDARFETAEQLRLAVAGYLDHRGSIRLAEEARARLERLDAEARISSADPEERRLRLYHLFGECRFGFEVALRAWPENALAKEGLREATERMVELELADGDPRAAAVLLATLEAPPPALATRVDRARKDREEAEARHAAMARDLDPGIGRRTRVFVGSLLGVVWTVGPLAWWGLSTRFTQVGGYAWALGLTLGLMAFGHALWLWANDSLSRTALNRALVRIVRVSFWAQLAAFSGGWLAGEPIESAQVTMIFGWALSAAAAAATVEAALWPSAVGFGLAYLLAAWSPAWRFPAMVASNLVVLVNVVGVWARVKDDLVEPLARRADDRRKRWESFLERLARADVAGHAAREPRGPGSGT